MRTLILCVDRDDDLGAKGGVQSPVIGRRRNLEAAMALGLADPEDSDTNAILAAVHVHDRAVRESDGTDQVEVATIAGLQSMGLKGDRKLSAELEQVLDLVRPDQVVLVSDGAEDEAILPILQSRTKVVHIHRSIVKQAPRLEGFYYTLTRILDDDKQAKRFVLPLAVLFLFWGVAFLLNLVSYAWGATLTFVGCWLLMHAMKWESSVSRVMGDLKAGIRSGKVAMFANLIFIAVLAVGALRAHGQIPSSADSTFLRSLHFVQEFLPFAASGFLILMGGRLISVAGRDGASSLGYWLAIFTLIAFTLTGNVVMQLLVTYYDGYAVLPVLEEFTTVVQLLAGLGLGACCILVGRYIRGFRGSTT